MHSLSTGSSTPWVQWLAAASPQEWMLAGAVLVIALVGLRSWYILRAQPARTRAGLGLFHVIRWAAFLSALAYVAWWLGR